jgi:hypothetical protein
MFSNAAELVMPSFHSELYLVRSSLRPLSTVQFSLTIGSDFSNQRSMSELIIEAFTYGPLRYSYPVQKVTRLDI